MGLAPPIGVAPPPIGEVGVDGVSGCVAAGNVPGGLLTDGVN